MRTELNNVSLHGKTVSITLQDGRIEAIKATAETAQQVALPLGVDPHVHLDKTFTASRCPRGEPGLFAAIETMAEDAKSWTEDDLRARMTRALEEASEAGVAGVRSHIDWGAPETPMAWLVLAEMAADWSSRISVQRASLSSLDLVGDADVGPYITQRVAQDDEVLGCFVYRNDGLKDRLDTVFAQAVRYGLALDFHVDEGLEIEADAFDYIVELTQRHGLAGRVLCGHACSLSVRPADDLARVMDRAAGAGVALTVLPTTNQWLQDGQTGRTPRLRGLAPVHELRAAGVPVLFGADNVADPFYRFGCYDPLETLRQAALAAHLVPADWLNAITYDAAKAIGFDLPAIEVGASANFMLIDGTDFDDALRSPRAARTLVRQGKPTFIGEKAA